MAHIKRASPYQNRPSGQDVVYLALTQANGTLKSFVSQTLSGLYEELLNDALCRWDSVMFHSQRSELLDNFVVEVVDQLEGVSLETVRVLAEHLSRNYSSCETAQRRIRAWVDSPDQMIEGREMMIVFLFYSLSNYLPTGSRMVGIFQLSDVKLFQAGPKG